jgi:muscarinic acetylcholine receptor M3
MLVLKPFSFCLSLCRKLKKKQEKFCKSIYKQLLHHPECQKILGLPVYHRYADGDASNAGGADFETWLGHNDWNFTSNGTFGNGTLGTTTEAMDNGGQLGPVLPPFELWQTILIAICLGICIILTVGGNILVLLAFIVDRSIRQPSNYFIASLAATDMLIGRKKLLNIKCKILKKWEILANLCF